MQDELSEGGGKQAYKDYISALRRWLIPYFGSTDIAKIDLTALRAFDTWRTEPRRVFRRLVSVSYAATSSVSRAA